MLTSCSRFRSFPLPIRSLSLASLPPPATQPSVLPFPSSRCRLTAAFPVPPAPLSLPWLSASCPPGCPRFPSAFCTWPFCWFPFAPPSSAPAAASLVLAFRFRLRPFPFPAAFFRPPRFTSDYSALCPCFSLLPDLPRQWFLRCCPFRSRFPAFPFRRACFHALLPVLVLSSLFFRSPAYGPPRRWLPRSRPHAFRFSRLPVALAPVLVTWLVCFEFFGSPQTSHILPPQLQFVNTYFLYFSTIILYLATVFIKISKNSALHVKKGPDFRPGPLCQGIMRCACRQGWIR